MLDQIRAIGANIREFNNDDESGMEAAQVILILAIAVLVIWAVFVPMRKALTDQGNTVNKNITDLK